MAYDLKPPPYPPPSKGKMGTNYVLWTGEGEVTRARGARNRAPLALVNP